MKKATAAKAVAFFMARTTDLQGPVPLFGKGGAYGFFRPNYQKKHYFYLTCARLLLINFRLIFLVTVKSSHRNNSDINRLCHY
jgi:hypothetical protein